jgi:predicted TIM-barrel fold metal-dependent hydrolase
LTQIIDFHVHISRSEHEHPWVLDGMAWMTRQPVEKLVAGLDAIVHPEVLPGFLTENHVDYAVALAEVNPIATGIADNDYAGEFCKQANAHAEQNGGTKLIPFCSINPMYTADLPGELERCYHELGFRGMKLYPTYQHFYTNDARVYPLYSKAEELGIPILIHTGSSIFKGARMKYGDPLFLDDVAIDFPKLNLVMAHGGRGFWYDRAFFLCKLHPNLFIDIAGLPPKRLLDYYPEFERLAHKYVFGSDWPGVASIAENIAGVRALPISEENKERILGGNAAILLGLDNQ